ncbi:MAG: N4-gp56 family major capsid protein [Oscillospiraceae bacterium]|nr:N4-gp56 family major capsid protein [Oscillospiraceae bacterium]
MYKNIYLQMDLQLFDDVMNTTTSAGLTVEMKTFYDKNLLEQASPKLVHAQFGQKRPIPKNGGKKIEFRSFASLPKALTPLTEGITPPGQTLEARKIEAELHQYGDYVKLTDVLELTAIDNMVVEATDLCGRQGGQTMDTVVRNILNTGTNVFYAPKLAADGTETEVTSRSGLDKTCRITCDLIDQVVAFLKAQNAPTIDGYYVAIIHPYAAYDLRKDERWRKPHEYCDPEHLYKGEIGEYGGVRFVDTSEAKIFSGDGCPEGLGVFSTLIIGADAYGVTDIAGGNMEVIVKQKGSAGTGDPLDQRSTVGWKAMQTAEILVENYMARIESCSDRYSAKVTAN